MKLWTLHMWWWFTTYKTGKRVDFLRTLHLAYVMSSVNATEQSLWGKKSQVYQILLLNLYYFVVCKQFRYCVWINSRVRGHLFV